LAPNLNDPVDGVVTGAGAAASVVPFDAGTPKEKVGAEAAGGIDVPFVGALLPPKLKPFDAAGALNIVNGV
jgi:hypothetical protein